MVRPSELQHVDVGREDRYEERDQPPPREPPRLRKENAESTEDFRNAADHDQEWRVGEPLRNDRRVRCGDDEVHDSSEDEQRGK